MNISVDVIGMDGILAALQPKLAAQTTVRSLNKAGAMAMTAGKRTIVSSYNIKYGDLKTESTKASIMNQQFVIQSRSRRRQMSKSKYFKAKQTSSGVVVEIQRGKQEVLQHAFIAKHSQGGTNVYLRSTKASKRVRRVDANGKIYYSQLPIQASLGPSVADLFRSKGAFSSIQRTVISEFPRLFKSQLSYELSKAYRDNMKKGIGGI